MPELPEVETIRRDLSEFLPGHQVVRMDVRDRRLLSAKAEKRFREHICGPIWSAIKREGKYLVAEFKNQWQLIFHLRMTGQLVLITPQGEQRVGILDKPVTAKYRLRLEFENGAILDFYDQRRFGEVFLRAPGENWPGKTSLGPDPLGDLSCETFVSMVKGKTTRIKPLLMDQSFLAGVGNIYAQEALFKAAIRPMRSGRRITREEATSLYKALQETLLSAIEHRGSTNRDYRDAFGRSGSAQELHTVYQRGGKPCLKCKGILRELRVGGRGTVYCPSCQR